MVTLNIKERLELEASGPEGVDAKSGELRLSPEAVLKEAASQFENVKNGFDGSEKKLPTITINGLQNAEKEWWIIKIPM